MAIRSGGVFRMVLAAVLACWAGPVFAGTVSSQTAGANPFIVVSESGVGTIQFPGQAPVSMPGIMEQDPGPGGLRHALTFDLLDPPSLVSGDVLLSEGDGYGDLIRFNAAGTGENTASPECESYAASLVFYSADDDGADSLADTGLPDRHYDNLVTRQEIGGVGNYTPTQGQPGYVAGYQVSYEFISDAPEPASWLLVISGGLLVVAGWRQRRA